MNKNNQDSPNSKLQTPNFLKILITAGPTWIAVDQVRILTNIFTGKTGLYLAQQFKSKGHAVTLVYNPHSLPEVHGVKAIPFHYFDEFKNKIIQLLKKEQYDVIIHSAAVSDYRIKKVFTGKIPSGKKTLTLELNPTEKVITCMRRLAKKTTIVQFKLEINRKGLIEKAYASLQRNKSDFVVANAWADLKKKYKAFLIDQKRNVIDLSSQKQLFERIYSLVKQRSPYRV